MTLERFSRRMVLRADQLGKSVNEVVKTAALTVDRVVVLATPVDTGRARSNWIVAVGSPRIEMIEPYAPGMRLGLSERGNASGAIAQARGAMSQRKEGQSIFITNVTDYLPELNNGSSRQAPKNFVEIGVSTAVRGIRSAKIFE